jgi:hypothetical protein
VQYPIENRLLLDCTHATNGTDGTEARTCFLATLLEWIPFNRGGLSLSSLNRKVLLLNPMNGFVMEVVFRMEPFLMANRFRVANTWVPAVLGDRVRITAGASLMMDREVLSFVLVSVSGYVLVFPEALPIAA